MHLLKKEIIIQILQRNMKIILLIKNSKKSPYYKLHRSDQFFAINLILGYIFENKTQKQKSKWFLIRNGQSERNIFI